MPFPTRSVGSIPTARTTAKIGGISTSHGIRREQDVIVSVVIRSVGYKLAISDVSYHKLRIANLLTRQQDQAVSLLRERGMARLSELTKAGVTAATASRMKARGLILQIRRGLYQLPDASFDVNRSLAEAAKLVPKGVICLTSALTFHEL